MNLCKDCEYFIEREFLKPLCKYNIVSKDPVTGDIQYNLCELCRKDNNSCGKDGKFFKKRIPFFKRLFKMK